MSVEVKFMKFSIITPAYNSEKYIKETIESVISQSGSFDIEYIVVDGLSTDGTADIIKYYIDLIREKKYNIKCGSVEMKMIREADGGMYDAINKGFSIASGDILAWINSDDIYLSGAFDIINKTFEKFNEIDWVKGITSYIDENSNLTKPGKCFLYEQVLIKNGFYGTALHFIQQDSVFWRRKLWDKVGNIDKNLKYAGDYYLWTNFSRYAKLFSINAEVSCFRKRKGQLSENFEKYLHECYSVVKAGSGLTIKVKLYLKIKKIIPSTWAPTLYKIFFPSSLNNYITIDGSGNLKITRAVNYVD